MCVRVSVCDHLKQHVVASSALYVVTVNGGMHRDVNSGPKPRILDVLGRKPKPKMLCNIYLFY